MRDARAIACRREAADMVCPNVDRHSVLALVDDLHEKHRFTDKDYKDVVEALSGKSDPLDVSDAKVVKIYFDEHRVTWNRTDYAVRQFQNKILQVVDTLDDPESTCPARVNWACSSIERSTLADIADLVARHGCTHLLTHSCSCCYTEQVFIRKIELIQDGSRPHRQHVRWTE